jgi:hypothetical protein
MKCSFEAIWFSLHTITTNPSIAFSEFAIGSCHPWLPIAIKKKNSVHPETSRKMGNLKAAWRASRHL